jgi:ribosome-binding factor A
LALGWLKIECYVHLELAKKEEKMAAKKGFKRSDRVADQIQKDVADLLRNEVRDPRTAWVTLTQVEVTRDYSHAKLFYTVMPTQDKAAAAAALQAVSGLLRSHLGKRLKLYSVPQLHFEYDESLERGLHMDGVLAKVRADDAKIRENFEDESDENESDAADDSNA